VSDPEDWPYRGIIHDLMFRFWSRPAFPRWISQNQNGLRAGRLHLRLRAKVFSFLVKRSRFFSFVRERSQKNCEKTLATKQIAKVREPLSAGSGKIAA